MTVAALFDAWRRDPDREREGWCDMQRALLRVGVWYVAFSVIVGGVLYALVPGLVPVYAVIALIGAWGVLSAARDKLKDYAIKGIIEDGSKYQFAQMERASAVASQVKQQPWFADSVVDMEEVGRRRALTGHIWAEPGDLIPNPFFVLPLPKLVTWGFATAVEVREAVRWANSPTPPVRWQNPPLRELLNLMGWSNAEAYARIGLFFWHTDDGSPSPLAASIEADLRRQNRVYDVPRPASLD